MVGFATGTNSATDDITSVTDTAGNTYTKLYTVHDTADYNSCEVWIASNITGNASNVITGHDSGSNIVGGIAYELAGVVTSSPVDQHGTKVQSYTSATITNTLSAATTNANDIVLTFMSKDSTGTWTADSNYTNTVTTNTNQAFIAQTRIVSSTSAYSVTETSSAAAGFAGVIVALKGASGGGGGTPTNAFFPFF